VCKNAFELKNSTRYYNIKGGTFVVADPDQVLFFVRAKVDTAIIYKKKIT
jgi:hypothetical protein